MRCKRNNTFSHKSISKQTYALSQFYFSVKLVAKLVEILREMLPGGQPFVKKFFENRKVKLLVFGGGIFISYAILGILQERIFRGSYGTKTNENGKIGDKFEFTVAFVAVQNIIYSITARGLG